MRKFHFHCSSRLRKRNKFAYVWLKPILSLATLNVQSLHESHNSFHTKPTFNHYFHIVKHTLLLLHYHWLFHPNDQISTKNYENQWSINQPWIATPYKYFQTAFDFNTSTLVSHLWLITQRSWCFTNFFNIMTKQSWTYLSLFIFYMMNESLYKMTLPSLVPFKTLRMEGTLNFSVWSNYFE